MKRSRNIAKMFLKVNWMVKPNSVLMHQIDTRLMTGRNRSIRTIPVVVPSRKKSNFRFINAPF